MNKKLVLMGAALLMTAATASAQKRVTGRVLDTNGEPVVGASVRVEGHKGATITDAKGNFTLSNVPSSATKLKVNYIGKVAQTVSISGNVKVVLADNDNELEEAVVVGYGKVKKGDFTGSVSAVKGAQITKMQSSNVTKALEGVMPGLQLTSSTGQPGSSASIYVRGIGSITASTAPLIIVDGAPYEGSLNSINPNDIESINLQKDASATSIYGARGANGIIYITTKKGSSDGKTRVTLDAKWGWNARGVKKYSTIDNPADYYEMVWESFYNRDVASMGDLAARLNASQSLVSKLGGYNVFNVSDVDLIDPITGHINPNARQVIPTNWDDEAFHHGLRQEYNVGISGGNDRTQYYLSFNYLDDNSYMKKSDFNRMTGRLRLDHKAFSWLTVGANLGYTHKKSNGISMTSSSASNIFSWTQFIAPIYPVYLYDTDGNLVYDENGGKVLDTGDKYGRTRLHEAGRNPLIDVYNNTNESISDVFNARGYADIKIYKGLTFHADVAIDNFQTWTDQFKAPVTADAATVNGYGIKETKRTSVVNATQRFNYDNVFGGKHSIGLMIAHETKSQNDRGLGAYRSQFFLPENNFAYSLTNMADPASNNDSYHLESFLGRAEYSYDHRYSLSATFRRDGSSMFAPESRWGSFWSVGAAWNIAEETWFKEKLGGTFNRLKLRASYGTQGNDALGVTGGYLDHYSISNSGTNENPQFSSVLTYRGNRDLTWEKSKTFDVGLEGSLFNNRLSFDLDFFVKNTSDMIGWHTLPLSQGSPNRILTNEQAMRNTGVEFSLNGVMIQNRNVTWSAQLNLTHYKNELTRMQEGRPEEGYQNGSYWRKKGGSLYDWYMVKYAGVDPQTGEALYYKDVEKTVNVTDAAGNLVPVTDEAGNPVYVTDAAGNPVLDAEGNPTIQYQTKTVTVQETTTDGADATKYQLGKSSLPKVYGGLTTTLQAYGFDLTIQTAFSIGGYTYDSAYGLLMNGTLGNAFSSDLLKRWQKPGDKTDVPILKDGYRMTGGVTNDRFLIRSDYFSIRNITLGYTLPQRITQRVPGLTSIRVYAVGDNLFLGSKRQGLDPRQSIDGAVSTASYSALRTISFGVNVNF